MEKRVCLAFVVLTLLGVNFKISGTTYYVQSPTNNANANDINPGTNINFPWATWQKAFVSAQAGDTVYFRGGTWTPSAKAIVGYPICDIDPKGGRGHNGTYNKPICFFNYPGEVPVLDGKNACQSTTGNVGIAITGATHLKFRGLTIRNIYMLSETHNSSGVGVVACGNISFENMTVHDIGGSGFWIAGYDTLTIKNCDAYRCVDNLDPTCPGGDGDGYTITSKGTDADTFKIAYISGSRAWDCSDDGWDVSTPKQLDWHDCWTFRNGKLCGGGDGIKLAYSHLYTSSKRKIYNCVSAFNSSAVGWVNLNSSNYGIFNEIYNITSYKDFIGFISAIGAYDSDITSESLILKNNIVYKSRNDYGPGSETVPARFYASKFDVGPPEHVFIENNSFIWDDIYGNSKQNPLFDINDQDFINVDSARIIEELSAPRKPDGSLPDLNFLRYVKGSDLIDAGIDVGLPFEGKKPDLGAIEYSGILVLGESGNNQINVDNGTLQLNPDILEEYDINLGITWSLVNNTGKAEIDPNGLVKALENGTVTAKATLNDGSEISGSLVIYIYNQITEVTDIIVTGTGGSSIISGENGFLQLNAEVLPVNATIKNVEWSIISGTGQAKISATGLVTAQLHGTVTAVAVSTDGSGITGLLNIQINEGLTPESNEKKVALTLFNSTLTINTSENSAFLEASIVNLHGQIVSKASITDNLCIMDVSYLPSSVYMVVLKDSDGNFTSMKFTKA